MLKALIASVFFLLASAAIANEEFEHPFFKAISGEWTGEGGLTNADGEVSELSESWTAEANDAGGFEFSGIRELSDQTQEFRWIFSYNVATESFESEYWHTGMEDPIRFEVSLTDDRADMVLYGGDSGGEIRVTNSLSDGGMESVVSVKDGNGQEVMGGTVNHIRVKSSDPE